MEGNSLNRRQFVAVSATALMGAVAAGAVSGCSSSNGDAKGSDSASKDKIIFIWEPNESTTTYEGMREAVAECIEEGCGLPCEMMTTTDYNVTIESLVSGKADMASLGASEYVEAHAKNPDVNIAFVLSNEDGELDQASYYSQICVRSEDADKYKSGSSFSLDNIKGKNFSFVNLNSTSGFVMPATVVKKQFGLSSTDECSESGAFFDTVLFPGSHPGSLFNLLNGDADVAVFADYLVDPMVELVSGEPAQPGTVYRVKEGVDSPLDAVVGKEFTIIEALPVPAVPICINTATVPPEIHDKIISYMCSDEVASNPEIFPSPDDKDTVSNWSKTSDKVCFVPAEDDYYDEFRELIDFKG
ncbi:phosphate/phosphite/phosphonate ABC transporter substrate-binding protein [uncultured Ellagibacter sp.]|uniref:phosphate/phosphite/phosphonate ABC transporter substrate-binding protein n=1 Tax=uncultured Ellagibacter sp. TaxID=2137580 RepID=UPI0026274039|nr:phosphate/phosphite/phosphonate ABC transporter substrate-binding protein [uncultured Ellagibacter sp.]